MSVRSIYNFNVILFIIFQETDLSQVLAALIARDEIHDVLSNPIPSATHTVNDAEGISVALHQDCVCHEAPRARPGSPSNLINLMTNITQQIGDWGLSARK